MITLAYFTGMNTPVYVNAALFANGILKTVDQFCPGVMCITSRPRSNEELNELMEFAGFLAKNN